MLLFKTLTQHTNTINLQHNTNISCNIEQTCIWHTRKTH